MGIIARECMLPLGARVVSIAVSTDFTISWRSRMEVAQISVAAEMMCKARTFDLVLGGDGVVLSFGGVRVKCRGHYVG